MHWRASLASIRDPKEGLRSKSSKMRCNRVEDQGVIIGEAPSRVAETRGASTRVSSGGEACSTWRSASNTLDNRLHRDMEAFIAAIQILKEDFSGSTSLPPRAERGTGPPFHDSVLIVCSDQHIRPSSSLARAAITASTTPCQSPVLG